MSELVAECLTLVLDVRWRCCECNQEFNSLTAVCEHYQEIHDEPSS